MSGCGRAGPAGSLVPFVINAQAGQPGYRVPLKQLLQADHTLTRVFSQHVICREGTVGENGGQSPAGRGLRAGWDSVGRLSGPKSTADLAVKVLTADTRHVNHTPTI